MQPVTVLLIEDDDVDVMIVRHAFGRHKLTNPLVIVPDAAAALEMLRGVTEPKVSRPYLILLDWNTPRMNGLEFLRELRADPKLRRSIVFVLSTSSDREDIAAAYFENVAGYITKSSAGDGFADLALLIAQYTKIVELL